MEYVDVDIIKYILLVIMLLIVSITDIKEFRIPNTILGSFILIRGGILIYEYLQKTVYKDNVVSTLTLVLCIFTVGVIMKLTVGDGIGFGDIKLLIVAVLYMGSSKGVYILYSSIFIMGVIDVIIIALRFRTLKDGLPFAPAVLLGTIVTGVCIGI